MFLSGPYSDVLNQGDIPLDKESKNAKSSISNDLNIFKSLHDSKSLSYSEGNVNKINRDTKNISRSLNSLNYDADTEYDSEPEMVKLPEWEWEVRCDVCGLQYSSPFEATFTLTGPDDEDSPKHDRKTRRKLFRRRLEKRKPFNPVVGGVNFEEFKDANHKLDKFDPTSERVWTLQYRYDEIITRPKLSKIIIGRGHRNEFPELNSIHLINEIENTKDTVWRNAIFNNLKSKKADVDSKFNFLSTNQSCLFCLYERNIAVNAKVRNGEPLCHVTDHNITVNKINEKSDNHSVDGKELSQNDNNMAQNNKGSIKKRFDLISKLKPIIKQAVIDDSPEEVDDEDFTLI